ncbi:hypothetical protein ABWL39_20295 [Chitinivorax sp. PXF-14]|uniref:hypothetical protein n=1 Tax=Chitinivorax sp. PXF-14 TaxID=3230488 RepID=UPI003467863B
MKYKHIDAMLHNFGHSFVSLMNYVDDQYILDVLPELALHFPSYEIDINFANGQVSPAGEYPEVLLKSIAYWKDWLPKHITNQRLEAERLSDIRVRYRLTKMGHEIIVSTTDDRGKEHKVFVRA